jgi:multiple sugar transport system permease protein
MVALYHQAGAASALPFSYLIEELVLASIPPIVLFLIFQRRITRGINLTGLKG